MGLTDRSTSVILSIILFVVGVVLFLRGLFQGDKNRSGEMIVGVCIVMWCFLYWFGAVL